MKIQKNKILSIYLFINLIYQTNQQQNIIQSDKVFIKFEQQVWESSSIGSGQSKNFDFDFSTAKFKNNPRIVYALTIYNSDHSSQQGFKLQTNSITQTKLNYELKSLGCELFQLHFNILAFDDPNIDVQQKELSSGENITITGTQDIEQIAAFIYGFKGSSGNNLKLKYTLTKVDSKNYKISFNNLNIQKVNLNFVIIYKNLSQEGIFQQLYSYDMNFDTQGKILGGDNQIPWQTPTFINSSPIFFGLKDFDISSGCKGIMCSDAFGIKIQSGQTPEAQNKTVKLNYFTWDGYKVNLINGVWMGFALTTCQARYTMFLNSTYNSCVQSCNSVDHHYNTNPLNIITLYSATLVICQQCDENCYGCIDGSPKHCTDCYNNQYLNPNTNTCEKAQPSSTYCSTQSVSGQTYLNCQKCDPTCKECSAPNNSKSCTSCNSNSSNKYFYQNQCLVWQPPSTYCDSNLNCYDCDSNCESCLNFSYNCQSCKSSSFQYQNTCLAQICTQQNQYYNPFTNSCQATQPSKTFCSEINLQGQTFFYCQKCDLTCEKCSAPNSASQCTSCDITSGNKYFYNNQCLEQQPESTYCDDNLICQKCDLNCSSCSMSSSNCHSCITNKYLYVNQCLDVVCDNNQYLNSITKSCSQTKPSGTYCIPVTQNGNNFEFCQKCDPNCLECNPPGDQKSCISCDIRNQNKYYYKNQCINSQPASTFCDEKFQCFDCDQNCVSCSNNSKNCQSCKSNIYFYENKCLESPLSGTYCTGYSNCSKCDAQCKTCEQTSNNCTSCQDQYYLYKNSCQSQKPQGVFCELNQNYYVCSACANLNCQECLKAEPSKCISCPQNYYFYKDDCFQKQIDSKYCEDNKCYDCDPSCSSCNEPSNNNCTYCKSLLNRSIVGNICACNEGYYEDSSKICQKCFPSCLTCNGPLSTQCLSCKNYIYQNTCYDTPPPGTYCDSTTKQQKCIACIQPNCSQCNKNGCINCQSGFRINDFGECVYCDNKMYANQAGICNIPCKEGCKICTSQDNCIKLDDTYKNCDVSCQTCTGPSASQCASCSSNTRLFDTTNKTCMCITNFEETGQTDCQYIYQVPKSIVNAQSTIGVAQFSILAITTLTNSIPGISYSLGLMQLLGNFYIRQDQTYQSQTSVLSSYTKYNLNSLFQQKILYPSHNTNQKVHRVLEQNSTLSQLVLFQQFIWLLKHYTNTKQEQKNVLST
ncbi:H-type lectin domain protein (macronuclear) [Tetrahymena thermophila SB210]|uniref:H-type lectin domain protein n=1 Tax=Tetrahymena thermophila (strain SB210) TaxID=312017 RepID=Q23C42_TETTS|nr:H-type lectin domain protein [Tetrahymena thermophila SB210]EAR93926.2 H-type lectin domain protein [Tetrahymena thermophila SB210]|eukprot:XP_001014171.2 H-type lectin domain protein [Tetrahymena thermophila SB210]